MRLKIRPLITSRLVFCALVCFARGAASLLSPSLPLRRCQPCFSTSPSPPFFSLFPFSRLSFRPSPCICRVCHVLPPCSHVRCQQYVGTCAGWWCRSTEKLEQSLSTFPQIFRPKRSAAEVQQNVILVVCICVGPYRSSAGSFNIGPKSYQLVCDAGCPFSAAKTAVSCRKLLSLSLARASAWDDKAESRTNMNAASDVGILSLSYCMKCCRPSLPHPRCSLSFDWLRICNLRLYVCRVPRPRVLLGLILCISSQSSASRERLL